MATELNAAKRTKRNAKWHEVIAGNFTRCGLTLDERWTTPEIRKVNRSKFCKTCLDKVGRPGGKAAARAVSNDIRNAQANHRDLDEHADALHAELDALMPDLGDG